MVLIQIVHGLGDVLVQHPFVGTLLSFERWWPWPSGPVIDNFRFSIIDKYFDIFLFTGLNEVVAKVIFLHLSVILFTGGVYLSAWWDTTPRETPVRETPGDTGERPVRILLECIIVQFMIWVYWCLFQLLLPANQVLGKVIFSEACVKNSVHRGGGAWSQGVCSQGGTCWRPPRDGHCCSRYASYWNAFLFYTKISP